MKILHVVGARPNFMKTAPVMREMSRRLVGRFDQILVHTGQHYDFNMSQIFFSDLGIPAPDEFLGIGSGTHADQTARIMLAFEAVVLKYQPDWVVVVGDVNSTLACALVSSKLGIKIAHIEAGLRSRDRSMPEEINRLLTDQLADLLFTPSSDDNENLLKENIPAEKIRFVGNVMIDSLVHMLPQATQRGITRELKLVPGNYVLATLHRPANVDDPEALGEIMQALARIGRTCPVIFPIHPRTRKNLEAFHLSRECLTIRLLDPLGYLDFLALMRTAKLVITDSGGVQEETTYLQVPCLTVRPNTERPVTLRGTNRLVSSKCEAITKAAAEMAKMSPSQGTRPEFWDGQAAVRIVDVFDEL